MTSTGIMHKIQSLLAEGKSSTEVIALGYKASTVYKAQRQMVQGRKPGRSSGNGVSTEVQQSPAKRQAVHPKPMTTRVHEPPDPEVEADLEVVQLKIDLRKAQLEGGNCRGKSTDSTGSPLGCTRERSKGA